MPHPPNFQPIRLLIQIIDTNSHMTYSLDPDQSAKGRAYTGSAGPGLKLVLDSMQPSLQTKLLPYKKSQ